MKKLSVLFVLCLVSMLAFAQSDSPPAGAANRLITLDVVVADRSGHAVPGLQRQDFQLMDNKLAQKIVSFRAVAGTPATDHRPLEVILVVDEVNTSFQEVVIVRQEIEKFLSQNGGETLPARLFRLLKEWSRPLPSQ